MKPAEQLLPSLCFSHSDVTFSLIWHKLFNRLMIYFYIWTKDKGAMEEMFTFLAIYIYL